MYQVYNKTKKEFSDKFSSLDEAECFIKLCVKFHNEHHEKRWTKKNFEIIECKGD